MRIFITSSSSGALYEFNVPDKYAAGQVIDESEAAALNRLVAENVARNKSNAVRRREAAFKYFTLLEVPTLLELEDELKQYVEQYRLSPVATDRRGDIQREAELVRDHKECVGCHEDGLCEPCLVEGRRRVLAKAGIAHRALADL